LSALPRPAQAEYAEYYGQYVGLVPDGDVLITLREQLGETLATLQGLSESQETTPYAPGKWSLREVVAHLIDTERVFAFRALAMARSEGVDLPGMDQDEWVASSGAGNRPLDDLAAEWAALRRANVHMFATMSADAGAQSGRASGFEFTVRSFPWIIAGHELWHRGLIERDYLGGAE
jgi:hypothetical protein